MLLVWYRILLVDGKQGFAASDVKLFEGTGTGKNEQKEGLPFLLIGVGAVVLGAIIGFVMWARRTTEGSWNETELWE